MRIIVSLPQNPTDDENQQLKAAEGLFYQEEMFELIMYIGLGVAVTFFIAGLIWEFLIRRPKLSRQIYMLFTGPEVHTENTCARGLAYC